MTAALRKKLIEVAMPLEAINAASAHEKMPGIGAHPRGLHLWWARRPLAACRAVLFAQLVDDPSEYVDDLLAHPATKAAALKEFDERMAERAQRAVAGASIPADDRLLTLEDVAIDRERQRLFDIIEELVLWENSTNEDVLERARAEIRRCCGDELPPVYDPFSGGGSIPLEAQRLGLPAHGSDLNPVAVMIGKAMIEIPPRFRDRPPVHPGGPERNHYRNAEGLAEDVRYYGEWMRDRAFERIGHLYPQVDLPKAHGGGRANVIAWIWARTVPSPDPAFADVQVPIASSFALSTKKDRAVWIEPVVDRKAKSITYRIRTGGTKAEQENAKKGTKLGRGAHFRCLLSGTAITPDHVKTMGKAGRMGQTLIAIVAEGTRSRVYLAPSPDHEEIARSARPDWKPEQKQPDNPRWFSPPDYGLETFGDLFTDRQLVALNTFSALVHEAREAIEKDARAAGLADDPTPLRDGGTGARAYAEAVSVYLAFGIDRCADFNNTIVRWSPSNEKVMNLFARQAIPMTWDFGEANVMAKVVGGFSPAAGFISQCIETIVPGGNGTSLVSDAQTTEYTPSSVVSTDPPYYDNIGYADLSDFFFCWMKSALRPIYPELFAVLATPKAEELVATPYRHGGRDEAERFFLDGMRTAIANMAQNSTDAIPATIYYAFKQSEIDQEGISSTGWATFLQAVLEAGYSVVGTWPVRSEQAYRMIASGTNALANSVVLVCRKKDPTAETVSRAEFIRALKRELPSALAGLQAANIAPADMPQSAIGPGMGIFSRYAAVLESDDSAMTVRTALQLINRELDEYLGGIEGEFDADTRFAITWFEQHGLAKGDYGLANSLATARGIAVDSVKHAGIVESAAGKVRILRRDELFDGWDPDTDTHLTIWECCQYLIHALETEGEAVAARLLRRIGPDRAEAARDLAYCLYDICANKRREAKEATAYNGLIAAWPELTKVAANVRETDPDAQYALSI